MEKENKKIILSHGFNHVGRFKLIKGKCFYDHVEQDFSGQEFYNICDDPEDEDNNFEQSFAYHEDYEREIIIQHGAEIEVLETDTSNIVKTIEIEKDFFEHLLNCLANQKYIHEVNADGATDETINVNEIQKEHQAVIDRAYNKGMDLLSK